ncbi:imidazoleglycerol-phosphate dehydratase [Striga asiatica]|uniref:Imidazoleglycerol-phosphate dehydratase n=1 Tax=Striga asiatica TaxID=4170 RepID=A0A5A7Q1Y1_STRAF|nr:imidazoleglycerol-phosphate dehydratase [Striga asiatica]
MHEVGSEVWSRLDSFGKIKLGLIAFEAKGSLVISHGGCLGRVKSAEPYTSRLLRVANLSCPLAPRPLPNPSIASDDYDAEVARELLVEFDRECGRGLERER